MRRTWKSNPSAAKPWANCKDAFIGPTVWELEGPMPILKMSKTLVDIFGKRERERGSE